MTEARARKDGERIFRDQVTRATLARTGMTAAQRDRINAIDDMNGGGIDVATEHETDGALLVTFDGASWLCAVCTDGTTRRP